ncbi:hypothetical protein BK706_14755 [Bacillus thuringiensis serovar leesis]|nr:hypothetical protein BK706_14755 [Bacillus thuringiensis serovar leesis]
MIFNNILIIFSSGFIFVPNMVREILNCLIKNQNLLFFVFRLKLLLNFHSKNQIMFNIQNIEKLKPLYINGFKLFILLAYPLQQVAIRIVYQQLVAITMNARFHKIITYFFIMFSFKLYAVPNKIIHLSKV